MPALNGELRVREINTDTTLQLSATPVELGKPAVIPGDGSEVWVPNVTQNSICVVNTASKTFTSFTLPNLFDSREIVFSRDSSTAYILFAPPASFGTGTLAIVDAGKHTLISSVKLGTAPSGLTLSPQGSYVFVANSGDGNVAMVDSSNNVTTFKVGSQPVGLVATH